MSTNPFDFNNADSNSFDLIPVNTIAPMILTIRPGSVGDGGWLTAGKPPSDAHYLNAEFVITGGRYRGRKFWQNMVVSGGKVDENGQSKAGNITRSTLRGILESARGIKADDESEAAKKARLVSGYGDFSGMEFVGKIGIEKGEGTYADKNKLVAPIGPENSAYAEAKAGGGNVTPIQGAASAPAGSAVPKWAA